MMIKKKIALIMGASSLSFILLFSGCKKNEEPKQTESNIQESFSEEDTTEEETKAPDTEELTETTESTEQNTEETKESNVTENPSSDQNGSRQLSQEELDSFTQFVQKFENNGFLKSSYDSVVDIDLSEVLVTGIGVDAPHTTEEEEKALEPEMGELMTDVLGLTTQQIDDFLYKKAQVRFTDIKEPLNWVYLPEFDKYYSYTGGVPFIAFECVGGSQSGDQITLNYVSEDIFNNQGQLTLKKVGDDYIFISNHIQ
ncbi:MAG TPA: hypothetical protein IAC41_03245 [Candidatus Merdenecus merdavium]|nr:hypothetical protein [Candidatus Merdenecus merdavium]